MKVFVNSIMGGLMIGVGGTIYLSMDNKVIGAFLFAIGLLSIVEYGFSLYTGKIGYIIGSKKSYYKELLITLLGNFVGTLICAVLIRQTRYAVPLIKKANNIIMLKTNDSYISVFILSILCGLLMYFAVNTYKKGEHVLGKYLAIFMGVMVFILAGFEHCVANMYYFSLTHIWDMKVLLVMFIMILGNSLGAIIIPLSEKYSTKK